MAVPASTQNQTARGSVTAALVAAAQKQGYTVTEISFEEMAEIKCLSRVEDARLIASGEASPEEIQAKNDLFPGKITVLDWSPAAL